jgi:hypothetical protein
MPPGSATPSRPRTQGLPCQKGSAGRSPPASGDPLELAWRPQMSQVSPGLRRHSPHGRDHPHIPSTCQVLHPHSKHQRMSLARSFGASLGLVEYTVNSSACDLHHVPMEENENERGLARVHAQARRGAGAAPDQRGHIRVGWGGLGQIGRRTWLGYVSAIHAKLAAVPASFAGASERLARSASIRTSVAGPAAVG